MHVTVEENTSVVVVDTDGEIDVVTVNGSIPGPQGPQGVQGPQGDIGPAGPAPDLSVYQTRSERNQANGYAGLDGSGLLPSSALPPLAISDTIVIGSQAAMLAASTQVGDVAVRTDLSKTFIRSSSGTGTIADWTELQSPGAVQSVNNKVGAVTLTSTDVNAVDLTPATSARNVIQPSAVDATPLVVRGTTSQTANLIEWQNSAGVYVAKVAPSGEVRNKADMYVSEGTANQVFLGDVGASRGGGVILKNGTTILHAPATNVLQVAGNGAGVRLTSPDGLITKTLSIDNTGALVVT